MLLTSRVETCLGWGPDIAFLYNDAYRPTLGNKHPRGLATPTRELWGEIWEDVPPASARCTSRANPPARVLVKPYTGEDLGRLLAVLLDAPH